MTNVLVVTAIGYSRLESQLDSLIEQFPEKQFEFYIVHETYGCKPPENPKYNYISSDNFLMDRKNGTLSSYAEKWPKFDYSIQTDEFSVSMLATLNSYLNLTGLKTDREPLFRDKVRMKQFLGNDVRVPKLYTQEDISNNTINYPVIIKPRSYATSRGVCFVNNKEELLSNIEGKRINYNTDSNDSIDDIEIEEYIDGDIFHIDGLVFNGEIVFSTTSKYMGTCLTYVEGKTLGSMRVPQSLHKLAHNFLEKVHRDLRIPDGAFHLECFLQNQEFVFLEIAIRPGGSEIIPSIEAATGVNLAEEHVRCQLGIEPNIKPDTYKHFGWLNFPKIFNDDSARSVKSITLPTREPVSLYYSKTPEIGESANGSLHYTNSLGNFIFLADNQEQLEKDMQTYTNEYKVEIE